MVSSEHVPAAGARDGARERVGTTLRDKWTLDRLLGSGGVATVYAATHRNGSRVAIKVLHPELATDADARARFTLEGYAANRVGHRGAVAVLDDDVTEDGLAFLVMELLDGESLESYWQRNGKRLPPGEVLGIASALLDVLVAAHAAGIVHRDLKPANLFLQKSGELKVLDFGIARMADRPGGGPVTQTGYLIGTPGFMPPEQARGRNEDIDARTDLFAVGATLFTLLSGRYLFEGPTINEQLALAMTTQVPPMAELEPSIPPTIGKVIDRALMYHREARYPSAQAMLEAVVAAGAGTVPAAGNGGAALLETLPASRPPQAPLRLAAPSRERLRFKVALAVAGSAVGAVLALALLRPGSKQAPAPAPEPRPHVEVMKASDAGAAGPARAEVVEPAAPPVPALGESKEPRRATRPARRGKAERAAHMRSPAAEPDEDAALLDRRH